jgi:hypothetical protein
VTSHTAVAPEQPRLLSRQDLQTFADGSHTGVAPPHCALETHWTHWPAPPFAEVSQTFPPPQPDVAVQVLQLRVVPSHTGALAGHWAFPTHPTQRPPATEVSQTGVAPEQPAAAVQVMHWPAPPLAAVSHRGALPEQPLEAVQVLQVSVAGSHSGVAPLHAGVHVVLAIQAPSSQT